jgi:hypothetical protein
VTAGVAAARGALVAAVAAGSVALMACGCRRADDRAAIEDRLRSKGAADVVREAAAARYAAPAAGRLTETQVRMFLEVRERECRIREAAALAAQRRRDPAPAETGERAQPAAERPPESNERNERGGHAASAASAAGAAGGTGAAAPGTAAGARPGSAAAATTDEAALAAAADLRAAQELHVNPKEYRWVRDRVLEAEGAATAQALYQKMTAGRELLLAHRRKELEAMTDPGERAAAQRDIEDWKRGLEAVEPVVPAALRANVALLARFREPLLRLRAVEERALAASAGLESAVGAGLGR